MPLPSVRDKNRPVGPPRLINLCYGVQVALNEEGYMGAKCVGFPVQVTMSAEEREQMFAQTAAGDRSGPATTPPANSFVVTVGASVMPSRPNDVPLLVRGVQLGMPERDGGDGREPAIPESATVTAVERHVRATEAHENALKLQERVETSTPPSGDLLGEVARAQASVQKLRSDIAARNPQLTPRERREALIEARKRAPQGQAPDEAAHDLVSLSEKAKTEAQALRHQAASSRQRRGPLPPPLAEAKEAAVADASDRRMLAVRRAQELARRKEQLRRQQQRAATRELEKQKAKRLPMDKACEQFWEKMGKQSDAFTNRQFVSNMAKTGAGVLGQIPETMGVLSAKLSKTLREWASGGPSSS